MTVEEPTISNNAKLNQSQAAAVLGVHRNTIARWVREGLLRVRVGLTGKPYIMGADIIRMWRTL